MRRVPAIIGVVAVALGALVTLASAPPAAASTPVITPRHGLPYYARVAVHAEKTANTVYSVSECFDTPVGEYCTSVGGGLVSAEGVLDTSVVLSRRYDFGDGRILDCAAPDAACQIVVDARPTPSAQLISFDPAAPVPTLRVTPDAGLGWRTPVTVTGSGFVPNQILWLTQCARTASNTKCIGVKHQAHPVVDGSGHFTFTLDAHRLVSNADDCVQPALRCFLRVLLPDEFYRFGPVDAPIAFADDGLPVVLLQSAASLLETGGAAHLEVRLTAPATAPLSISYSTRSAAPSSLYDLALAGTDYVAKTSHLRFQPGESRHVIRIAIVDDRVRENGEAFDVGISGSFHAPRRTGSVFISDNDF